VELRRKLLLSNIAASAIRGGQRQGRIRQGGQGPAPEIHTVLKQVDYDYQRMQYNTVVSGAMKMLNALETSRPTARPAPSRADRRLRHPAARALPRHAAHRAQLWSELGYAALLGDLLDAPWPRSTALVQDEIELVLQVNGKLRGAIRCPPAPTRPPSSRRPGQRGLRKFAEGAAPKVVIVPGAWSTSSSARAC
jgi:leucyl-tRNA synthetase